MTLYNYMRPTLFTLFAAFLYTCNCLSAQPAPVPIPEAAFVIRGKIVDGSTDAPLDYATISVFDQADSSLVNGNITDEAGNFRIEVRPGTYFVKVEFLAYQARTIRDVTITRKAPVADLGVVRLQPEAAALDEVLVVAEKSQMEMGLDKKVFNVGKDLSSQGGTAAELLDNVPTLQVDVEGNLSLRGSQGVRILINGRPSGLIGTDPAAGLRSIPANLIERVEVITNPSARYEAEGMAGIINIVLKKDKRGGFNGSFDVSVGVPERYGASFNLNYRASKLNFFANYGLSYNNRPGESSLTQEVFNRSTGVTTITQQESDRLRGGLNNSFRFGADYSLSPKSLLTLASTLRLGDDQNTNETRYIDYLENLNNPVGIVDRLDQESEDEWRTEVELSWRKEYDKKDQVWTADVRYQDNSETEASDLSNQFFTAEGVPTGEDDLFQRSNNDERSNQLIFQTDYVHPFGDEGKFEAGLRQSVRNIDNDYLVEELQEDDVWLPLEGLSNNFRYDERISAAYLIVGDKPGRISWQIGIRPEYTWISTLLLQTNEENVRDFFNVFPSAFLGYELSKTNSIQVSYSRRVNRPRFWDLNPFFSFSDNRNFRAGNPNLDPEFTDSYELSHLLYWDNGSLGSSIYYRYTTNKIERIRTVDENNNSITLPQNLLTENAYGLEFTASYDPYKWWRLNADFNFYRAITDGGNLGENFSADTYTWFTRGTTRFNLSKQTDLQIRFNYRAPQNVTQGRRRSFYSFDLAASQDVLNGRGTLTLSVRDLLNSRRWRYTTEGETAELVFFTEGDFQWRARQATLTFNYRLNQDKRRSRGGRGGDWEGGEEY